MRSARFNQRGRGRGFLGDLHIALDFPLILFLIVLEVVGARREDDEAIEDEENVRLPQTRVTVLDCLRIDLASVGAFIVCCRECEGGAK